MTIYRWAYDPLKKPSPFENLADRNPDELTLVPKVYQRKEWGRMEDWRQLAAGEIAAEELNDRNSLVISRALTENPEWKRTALKSVIDQMSKDHH